MKSKIVSLSILLCLSLAVDAEAQRRKKQTTQPKQPATQTTGTKSTRANSAKQKVAKEYKEGETYSLDDVVNLNADGDKLTVDLVQAKEVPESKECLIEVKVTVSGKLQSLEFTYGTENSAVTLVANDKTIPASDGYFTDEVVAFASEPTMLLSARGVGGNGTLVVESNKHPIVFQFKIPDELSKASKQLELTDLKINKSKYSLIVKLNK